MELRQLKYFVKTAETLNFSEAARELFITQSTLSQQVRCLEQELGVDLFQRDSHGVMLTENGERLLPIARRTLEDADQCFTQISDLKQMLSGVLNIGISYTFAPVLMEAVKEFTAQYPGVRLNIICRTMEELLELLKKREVDFVLCFKPHITDNEIESHILFDNQLSVIVSRTHPLAERSSIGIGDILPYRVVMPARETQARKAFELFFPGTTEKLLFLKEGQYSPNHFHWYKTEDIINRGGGNVLIRVYNSKPDESIDYESDVTVHTDGRTYTVPAGTQIRLTPGESIYIQQRLYHDFTVEPGTGDVLLGEVSQCNDDANDNRFNPPMGRFPAIEEDEAPYRLLCNEYPAAKD